MPRPGPRPYECVKKAWHSDRHQPMRGSIIQQIFRIANETHSSATRKNKEWLEKLPIVVFKAEEIMYSKANSEVEYTSLETLLDRVNDAINTIIRRDESSESGELLPPCIEAALNLGCIPVRASRSQRHSNPRTYLSPRFQEPTTALPRISDKANDDRRPQLLPLHSSNQLNFARATTTTNIMPISEPNYHIAQIGNVTSPRCMYGNISLPGSDHLMTQESNMPQVSSLPQNLGSVYPLYYGNHCQIEESLLASQAPGKIKPNTVFVGKPIGKSVAEPAETSSLQNFFSCPSGDIPSQKIRLAGPSKTHERPSGMQCDLSLRLSLVSDPYMNMEISSQDNEDADSSSSQNRGKCVENSPPNDEGFCFFPGSSTNEQVESCSIKRFSGCEDQNFEATKRKRKSAFSDDMEDVQLLWWPQFPSNRYIGRMEGPGL
uniref:Histone acetyltransferase n=1 Tax=Rhizophora mucronata TaxID=61149 RepID=A0A2P2QR00_RHIMU